MRKWNRASGFREDRESTRYVIGVTTLAALLLICCTLHCYICRRLRKKRRYDEVAQRILVDSSFLLHLRRPLLIYFSISNLSTTPHQHYNLCASATIGESQKREQHDSIFHVVTRNKGSECVSTATGNAAMGIVLLTFILVGNPVTYVYTTTRQFIGNCTASLAQIHMEHRIITIYDMYKYAKQSKLSSEYNNIDLGKSFVEKIQLQAWNMS